LDVGTDDGAYLDALEKGLSASTQKLKADRVISLAGAGADPFKPDRLGRLALTKPSLTLRAHLVLKHVKKTGLPVAVTMAGGYAPVIQDIGVTVTFRLSKQA